jgi:hypothetical protein
VCGLVRGEMKEGFDSFICRDRERYKIFLEPNLSPLQIGGLGEERVFIAYLDSSSLEPIFLLKLVSFVE